MTGCPKDDPRSSCCARHPRACRVSAHEAPSHAAQRPSSSLDFSAHAVREFQPARRAKPSVCVVTVMTANLLGGWGGHAVEQTLNWALAHGYTYALFTERLVPETIPAVWSNPRAVHVMLERGEDSCAVVFYLDGDAVVNNVSSSLEGTIERLLPLDGPSFVFPCHSPFAEADGATCHVGGQCLCGRAAAGCSARALERMAHRKVTGAKHVPWCLINSGAYLVRNTARARARMRWWAERDGCEAGTLGRGAPEQACAQHMKALWPAEVDVVSARLFNTPAWFDAERVRRSTDPIAEYVAMRLRASSPDELRCFGDPHQLVCHLWNAVRRRPPQVLAIRQVAFTAALAARRPQLRQLLSERSERYRYVAVSTAGSVAGSVAGSAAGGSAASAVGWALNASSSQMGSQMGSRRGGDGDAGSGGGNRSNSRSRRVGSGGIGGSLPPAKSRLPLVLGVHESQPARAGLLEFLSALRSVLPPSAADVVIVSERRRVGEGVEAACAQHGASLHRYAHREYTWVRNGSGEPRRSKRWNDRLRKAIKFAVARDVLRERLSTGSSGGASGGGGLALLADVSDVSFQASPFEPPPPAEQLYVGAEANRYGELANPSSVGGDEMLRSDGRDPRTFAGRTVLNSGVILGQLPTLLAYLDWLLASAGPWCDQGRLNAFALAFPERVTAPPLGASRFLTFDRFDLGRLKVDGRGLV